MSVLNILDRDKRLTIQTADGTVLLKVDATTGEEYLYKSQATKHPVPEGAPVTDHIIDKGRSIKIQGVVTDHPITLIDTAIGNAGGIIGGLTGTAAGAFTGAIAASLALEYQASGSDKPSVNALEILEAMRDNKLLLTIVSGLRTFSNMAMVSLVAPRSARSANELRFEAQFEELRIVTGETVDIPPDALADDVKDSASASTDLGSVEPEVPTGQLESASSSALFKVLF